jgi:hypothetical protein
MIRNDGYFDQYKAPIFEASCADHIEASIINHSCPYFGPLLYWLVRSIGINYAMEIGVCKAYTSYFIASGIKDNMTRQGIDHGQYWGVDISLQLPEFQEQMRAKGLPVTMLVMDSWNLKPDTFGGNQLGLAFIDGWHSRQHVLKEMEIIYPMMLDKGRGYIVLHDTHSHINQPILEILKDPRYKLEYIRFMDNYGLTILRKMDNYVEDPLAVWPQGPEVDIVPEGDYYGGKGKI